MLYKNDVIVELSRKGYEAEIQKVEDFFHNKFPVRVVYPPDRIVKSRLPHSTKPDQPNSISFDLKSVVKTKTGTETWRYAEEVVVDKQGNKRYSPKKFRYAGSRYLNRNDIELIYFLLDKSEYRYKSPEELQENPDLVQPARPKFMFEDPIGEAEKRQLRKQMDLKIGNLIFSNEEGLTEEKIRAIANAFFMKNVDTQTLAEVRVRLDQKIHASKAGEKRFLDMINNDRELNNRLTIQNAIKKKLIFFDESTKKWFWNTDENKTKLICSVPPSKNGYDAIFDLFNGDDSFQADVKSALLATTPGKKKKVGAGVGGNTDEDE